VPDCAENELFFRARAGERGAFDLLRKELEPRARRFVHRLVGQSEAEEDIIQDVFLALYLKMGTGDMAVRSFQGLQASVAQITNDPYVPTLSITVPESATDVEKVNLVRLAAGQLVAYLEGQTGLAGAGVGGSGNAGNASNNINVQRAPSISIHDISGLPPEAVSKILEVAEKALKGGDQE
jgi:hypothetical protein